MKGPKTALRAQHTTCKQMKEQNFTNLKTQVQTREDTTKYRNALQRKQQQKSSYCCFVSEIPPYFLFSALCV